MASNQSRLRAQLEILEQAEQTLSGYADGARFLLDPGRQSRLQVRGSFSGMLQVPAELETAIAAALGDAVDTVLLETGSIDQALEMLDAEDAGRAVMLPLESRAAPSLRELSDGDIIGVASRLVQAAPEARAAVDALLGTTFVVRTRAAALRLRRGSSAAGPHGNPAGRSLPGRWADHGGAGACLLDPEPAEATTRTGTGGGGDSRSAAGP